MRCASFSSRTQVVDAPPGTSDEHISIAQYLRECGVDGAVIVTTPQEVALADVRKELSFCKKVDVRAKNCAYARESMLTLGDILVTQVGIRVLGVVENMSGAPSHAARVVLASIILLSAIASRACRIGCAAAEGALHVGIRRGRNRGGRAGAAAVGARCIACSQPFHVTSAA